ncbi:MAG: lipid-A-disaccharide synthase-related protein [Candidatus Eremiobacterota bacterium]
MNILFISNGYGEDSVAALLIEELRKRKVVNIKVLPLVGIGEIFDFPDVEILGPRVNLPSGGLINNNLSALIKDIKAGLLTLTLKQIDILRKSSFDLIICVGDRYPVILAGLFTSSPLIFVAIAQSVYGSGYSLFEKLLMKGRVNMVFPRDAETDMALNKWGISSRFLGNPMMDTFPVLPCNIDIPASAGVITILPGSRSEIWYNTKISLSVCRRIYSLNRDIIFLMALSQRVLLEEFYAYISKEGWNVSEDKDVTHLVHSDGTEVKMSQKYFGYMINRADAVLGQGGTANEQAAGLGKPVVTFWSPERQVRPSFMKHQKSLLGDSLIIVSPEPEIIAEKLLELLKNPVKAHELGQIGSARMGGRGGGNKIVDYIIEFAEHIRKDNSEQERKIV